MKTKLKKSAIGLMMCATLVLTFLPAGALQATTPVTIGTTFPLYVSSRNIDGAGLAGIVKVDSSGIKTVVTQGGYLNQPSGLAFGVAVAS